jgi:hypothetical protein
MTGRTTKAGHVADAHQQGGIRAAADSQNSTALHQASQIPGNGGFCPFSTQKGSMTESRSYFSWSRCPVGVTDPSL